MFRNLCFTVALSLLPGLWCSTVAQSVLSPRSSSPKDKAVEDKYRSDEMERVRRDADKREERRGRSFPRIKEDFERIQVINNDVLQRDGIDGQLNYKEVAEAAAEVTKRASRLKGNLFSSTAKGTKKQIELESENQADVKRLLNALDDAISGFVHNRMFENLRVVDPDDATNAQRDLENIIRLSKEVSKRAKKTVQ